MQDINYKQEFPLLESFYYKDEKGDLVNFGFPPYDFIIKYWTSSLSDTFDAVVKYVHGEIKEVNCKRVGDKLLVIFDRHKLNPGELKAEMTMFVPDSLYPDGIRADKVLLHTGVRLVHGPTSSPSRAEAMAIMPYIKGKDGKDGVDGKDGENGKDFTYEDLTEDQINDLSEKIADKVIDEGIEGKIDEAIQKKLEDEFTGFENISDDEFDSMFK